MPVGAHALGGRRWDDRGAADAEGEKGLEGDLDAGAAARVGARDGKGDRCAHVLPLPSCRGCRRGKVPVCGARSLRRRCPDQVRWVGACASQPLRAPQRIGSESRWRGSGMQRVAWSALGVLVECPRRVDNTARGTTAPGRSSSAPLVLPRPDPIRPATSASARICGTVSRKLRKMFPSPAALRRLHQRHPVVGHRCSWRPGMKSANATCDASVVNAF